MKLLSFIYPTPLSFPEEINLERKKVEKALLQAKLDLIDSESRVKRLEKQFLCLLNHEHPFRLTGEIDNEEPSPYYLNTQRNLPPEQSR